MGVQGLVTLLETHRQIYLDVQFMNRRLVIDGCNLIYLLYFASGLDQNHGGEYAALEDLIKEFVTTLRDCGIAPYVVLDGGSDYTDKKLETTKLRAMARLKKAHQAVLGGTQENVLPQLAMLVFKQTLARLEVPVAQCFGEADQQIAALASDWECPVLSSDSDFYIFDLPAGMLPLNHFQWRAVKRNGLQSYIPCKSYKISSFCAHFPIQRHLLPTFAALAGNDYVKLQRMESSISWAQFSPAGSRLEGLLCWLSGFDQPHEALEAALELMGELSRDKKAEVLQGLYLGIEEYKLPPSSLKRFFIHGTAPPFPAVEEELAGLIPDWTRLPLTQARLTPDILDVLLLHRMPLSFPVDCADLPSSNFASRPLRQVTYGLLLGGRRPPQVQESDREGLELKLYPVQPTFTGVTRRLTLNSLDKAEPALRLQVLLEALGVTEASLSRLPPHQRLPVAVTCYWMKKAQPPPDQRLLKALLLGLINGHTLRHTAAQQNRKQPFNQKLDVYVVHAFNQWQGCLKHSIHLNQLLGWPLPEPQIARLYKGTLVHQLVHRMRTGGKLRSFLKSDRSSVKQYQSMLAVVLQLQAQVAPPPSGTQRTAAVAAPRRQRQPPDDLTADLQQLFLLHEDDEETAAEVSSAFRALQDLHLDDQVSVKTRYRAKDRNNRSKNPELARKEECRGRGLL